MKKKGGVRFFFRFYDAITRFSSQKMRSGAKRRRKNRRERNSSSGGFEVSNFRGGDLVQFETNTKRKLRDLEMQKFRFQGTIRRRLNDILKSISNLSLSLFLFISLNVCFISCSDLHMYGQ